MVLLVIGSVYIRRKLTKWQLQLDDKTHTQSDFGVMAHGISVRGASVQSIEKDIKEFLAKKHGITEIEYISPCFKNAYGHALYKKLISKETLNLKLIMAFIRYKGITEEDYNKMVKAGKVEEGMPTVTSYFVFSKPLSLEITKANLAKHQSDLASLHVDSKNFSGDVLIVMTK